jgi:hypothetical protein
MNTSRQIQKRQRELAMKKGSEHAKRLVRITNLDLLLCLPRRRRRQIDHMQSHSDSLELQLQNRKAEVEAAKAAGRGEHRRVAVRDVAVNT